jgi:hypothetical protein
VLAGQYETQTPIAPKLREFEVLLQSKLNRIPNFAGETPVLPVEV